ncbi:hypothetical protein DM813_23215 [Pseudomonas alkylphenolica]|uniref:Uncharacterized protein n=1 Tax=Pseudomonas alkylphenolica TaxID=237609 RepID=A0A443ZK34_9PSED|nr:hypothetical protein [Pseudomonas alkylphenolica]RWU19218.1 hypothetical protein DM813_23215 [Pseudomonas alkylphenolica]
MAHQKHIKPASHSLSCKWKSERSAPPSLHEVFDAIEHDDAPLDQQRQAIMRLYQLILDAYQAESLALLDLPDEAVALGFLDTVDALAVAPIFEDDTTQYQGALLAARKVVGLINAGHVTFRVSSEWA